MESIESRTKRLSPGGTSGSAEVAPAPALEQSCSEASAKAPAVAPSRSDVQLVRNLKRGSASEATASFRQLGAGALIDELVHDRMAQSGVASASSLLSTLQYFHKLPFEDSETEVPVYPLTLGSLLVIASLFKKGGYRPFPNYLSAAKGAHIEAGREWTQLLAHIATWVDRSVLRGIGPARQSCSFDLRKLCLLPRSPAAVVAAGPQQPVRLALLATLFLLREVEASPALLKA